MLLHELPDFPDLISVAARNERIDAGLVEKDYWIMHCLWGLQQLGYVFELKGGTSLSKGFGLIERFSEDIDILIHPDGGLLPAQWFGLGVCPGPDCPALSLRALRSTLTGLHGTPHPYPCPGPWEFNGPDQLLNPAIHPQVRS